MRVKIHYSNEYHKAKNCWYINHGTAENEEQFKRFVAFDHVFYDFKDDYRSVNNFLGTSVAALDCDNDHSEDEDEWITFKKFTEYFPDVRFIVYTSRNHMKWKDSKSPRPRFHILFPIERITSADEYKALLKRLQKHLPVFDERALDAGRFYFGNKEAEVYFQEGEMSIIDFLEGTDCFDYKPLLQEPNYKLERSNPTLSDLNPQYSNDIIPEGKRNSTMSQIAAKLIKRFGDTDKARRRFMLNCNRCSPPLDSKEIESIWKSAQKFFKKISASKEYILPEKYEKLQNSKPKWDKLIGREPRQPNPPLKKYNISETDINGNAYNVFNFLCEVRPEENKKYLETDIGAGRLFADCYKDIARYVPERKCWYCYEDGVWTQDIGDLRAMEYMKELANVLLGYALKIENEYRREQYIKYCSKWQKRHNRDIFLRDAQGVYPISMQEFDIDPYIFNCSNGTLHLDTMEFTEHRASDRLTKISDVKYNPEAKCTRFNYFVGEICEGDEDKMTFLQKALGYGLSGDTRHECLFILYGATTRNGKGTLCESVLGVLGDYGCTSRPETVGANPNRNSNAPSEDIARLAGKRFVNISEPSKGLNLDAAKLKAMTGNDSLNARFLNENSFDFKPQFKIYINTNYLPVVTDMTLFTSGRIITVPFERHFDEDEQDKTLKAEFAKPENKSAILNWLIEGFKMQKEDGLSLPYSVQKATENYQNNSDKIRCFVDDCLILDAESECKTADVYARYKEWCSDNGYYPEGTQTFKQGLLTFAEVKKKRPKFGGSTTTMLLGYKMRS